MAASSISLLAMLVVVFVATGGYSKFVRMDTIAGLAATTRHADRTLMSILKKAKEILQFLRDTTMLPTTTRRRSHVTFYPDSRGFGKYSSPLQEPPLREPSDDEDFYFQPEMDETKKRSSHKASRPESGKKSQQKALHVNITVNRGGN